MTATRRSYIRPWRWRKQEELRRTEDIRFL